MIELIMKRKKKIALGFGIFILMLSLFFMFLSSSSIMLRDYIKESAEYRQERIEEYKELKIFETRTFLDTIEEDWIYYTKMNNNKDYDTPEFIDDFVANFLNSSHNMTPLFFVALEQDGEIEYYKNNLEQYEDIPVEKLKRSNHTMVLENWMNPEEETFVYENRSSKEQDFGTKNRFYYNSTILEYDNYKIIIYSGFLEKLITNKQIDTYDTSTIKKFENQIGDIIIYTIIVMSVSVLFISYIIYQLVFLASSLNDIKSLINNRGKQRINLKQEVDDE